MPAWSRSPKVTSAVMLHGMKLHACKQLLRFRLYPYRGPSQRYSTRVGKLEFPGARLVSEMFMVFISFNSLGEYGPTDDGLAVT